MAKSTQLTITAREENLVFRLPSFKLRGVHILLTLVIGVILALYSANPGLTILSFAFVPFAFSLLWRNGEPPVLFFGVLFQWLSITAKIWYANLLNKGFVDIQEFPAVPETIEKTFLLSLAGLVFLTLGIYIALRRIPKVFLNNPYTLGYQYDPQKIIYAYLLFYPLSIAIKTVGYAIPGMQQSAIMLLQFKWGLFFLLIFTVATQKRYQIVLYLILLGEVILGFSGYFSSFKEVFIMAAISFLTFGIRLKPFQYVIGLFGALIVFNLSVIWTSIKPEYRSFLSGGEFSQTVTVSQGEALGKAFELYERMSKQDYDAALVETINRISYIEYFSASVSYVPNYLPHQQGKIWQGAIEHVLLPRLLFPNKAAIDDSEQTAKYTGLFVSGKDTGTSISLGYMAESYVDFGVPFMFVPLFLLGLLIGSIYRYLLIRSHNTIWGYTLIIPVFYITHINGMASTKVLGSMLMYFLVALILNRLIIPRLDFILRVKR